MLNEQVVSRSATEGGKLCLNAKGSLVPFSRRVGSPDNWKKDPKSGNHVPKVD